MKRVLCFGEALIDFLNTGREQDGELQVETFSQYPGGAPANAAVAVAKLGGNAAFAGQVGEDRFGRFLVDTLQHYGVDTQFTVTHPVAKTALAFVFLDGAGERSFSFRRDKTADVVFETAQVSADWFANEPVIHICSNTLTDSRIAEVTNHVVNQARMHNCIVSFDVNLRHNLWESGHADAKRVNDLVRKADVVKFSKEEIDYLRAGDSEGYLQSCFDKGMTAALITNGSGALTIHTAAARESISPPRVEAVDTTGGGDAFVGAVLFGLSQQSDVRTYLADMGSLKRLVSSAARCGAIAVTRKGAFPSFPTFADVEDNWDL